MYNRETLIEALAEIVKVCKEFKDCDECPMYSIFYKTCLMEKESPEEWELTTDTTPWRAIR